MKKILGLDLGVNSIGWALIDEDEPSILGIGTRVVPLSSDDKNDFIKGNAISQNQKRTIKRGQRRGYDRYQLRRNFLIDCLSKNNMLPDDSLKNLPKLELWELRASAVDKKVSLPQLGRILLHLNQKRGYKSNRKDTSKETKETDYVSNINTRYEHLKQNNLTIGKYFYSELSKNQYFRIKQLIYPRDAYVEEFNSIIYNQQKYYPDILTDELIKTIRDEIIYYQRPLKSQKHLVSICPFEGFYIDNPIKNKNDKIFVGPKVAHRSSPLFQVCKIWESINNITINHKHIPSYQIPLDKKFEIFNYLNNNETLPLKDLLDILSLDRKDIYSNKMLTKGLQGNLTRVKIINCFKEFADEFPFENFSHLFTFDINIINNDEERFLVDRKSGEIVNSKNYKIVSPDVEEQPFYKLWHTLYSISDDSACINSLIEKFHIPLKIANKLVNLNFSEWGYSNKSHRAIRKILPYLMEGDVYSDACSYAGYNHSFSLTKNENINRQLLDKLNLLPKNSLRQPIVEKILNQMINLVNSIIDHYGKPDEIRIELARELKMSKDERNDYYKFINANESINNEIANRLKELNLPVTKRLIDKYKLIFPINSVIDKSGKFSKSKFDSATVINQCIYCGQSFNLSQALSGLDFDVDHIIPQSLLFDDSLQNKVLVHRKCNADKLNSTAYDFMRSKGEDAFNDYLTRIDLWFKNGIISYSKLERLKLSYEDYLKRKASNKTTAIDEKYWESFIQRQLKETQYISRKSREILSNICHNVWSTTGSITAQLRHIWGWDNVIEDLRIDQLRDFGLTTFQEYFDNDKLIKKEKIINWSKRDDQRHHAIDALTIACTKQSFIQRINTLNSTNTKNEIQFNIDIFNNKNSSPEKLLENYILSLRPFSTQQVSSAVKNILVSYKQGKKLATYSRRIIKKNNKKIIVQNKILAPRGALSEESIYGKIKIIDKNKPLKYIFTNPHLIVKNYIRNLVEERLYQYDNNPAEAIKSLKKNPIYLDDDKKIPLKYASCYSEQIVIKKNITSFTKLLQVYDIIDPVVRQKILDRVQSFDGNIKEALKNLDQNPIWYNEEKRIPINSVRCFTGLDAVEPLKFDENGNPISFVKPGNNHHLTLYLDDNNKVVYQICTFWHAVERKKFGFPVIIKNPSDIEQLIVDNPNNLTDSFLEKLPNPKWKFIESFQQNELFILNLPLPEFNSLLAEKKFDIISKNLYRLQNISTTGYKLLFRHHLATSVSNDFEEIGISSFNNFSFIKVKINYLGMITK